MRTPATIVITGATSGLGRLAAIALAKQGVRLGITARSQQRADATRTEIQLAAPGTVVDLFLADLARMEDVRKIGADIAARRTRSLMTASSTTRRSSWTSNGARDSTI